jgi:dienelactone hydrolase
MSINKFNAEGYYDPTAHAALSAIEAEEKALRAFRPIVYICSPYAGNTDSNVAAAQKYSRFAANKGYIPIAPHLLFPQFMNDSDPKEREMGLFFGNALMSKCSEVWVFGERVSDGMAAEIKRAKWKNYRLRYFSDKCEEVQDV